MNQEHITTIESVLKSFDELKTEQTGIILIKT